MMALLLLKQPVAGYQLNQRTGRSVLVLGTISSTQYNWLQPSPAATAVVVAAAADPTCEQISERRGLKQRNSSILDGFPGQSVDMISANRR